MANDLVRPGRLYLMPNTLDFGTWRDGDAVPDLQAVLPQGALQVAARLTHWVVENAKSARSLLKRIDAVVPLTHPLQDLVVRELPRPAKGRPAADADLRDWLAPAVAGHDVGLLSEAGLPAVADPGSLLVRAAHAVGVPVVPMSGPSSLMLALAASGLNGQSFAFIGYLPVEATARQQRIRELEALSRRARQTQIAIETPYRNQALFDALVQSLAPATQLSVSCGLTVAGGFTRTAEISRWRADRLHLPTDVPTVFCWQA